MLERVDSEPFGLIRPGLADELVGREAFEGLETACEVVGCDEVGEVAAQRVVAVVVEAQLGRNLDKPTIRCVVVLCRGKRDSWQRHVGFYAGRAKHGHILVLGGNQGDAVSIRPYSASQLLGYRWPRDVALPPDIEPLAKSGVVQGTSIAVASGGAIVAESLPALVTELEPLFLCGPAIRSGALDVVLPQFGSPGAGLYVVRPPSPVRRRQSCALLTQFLLERFADCAL